MLGDYVMGFSSAIYNNKILLYENDCLDKIVHYSCDFIAHGFEVVNYIDDLSFRIEYEGKIDSKSEKILVLAKTDSYIPYDIQRRLSMYILSFDKLFPRLNVEVLKEQDILNLDLLCQAYKKNFDDLYQRKQTEDFIRNSVYSVSNVKVYLDKLYVAVMKKLLIANNYKIWMEIAEEKSQIDVLATKYKLEFDTSEINRLFKEFVLAQFGKLSSEMSRVTPVLVSKMMEYMRLYSEKFVIIVMDGMSEFDWRIISQSFSNILYEQTAAFAMIPTTTSISRQCLLANKYPSQLIEPWKQSKEKQEFFECARGLGYSNTQIGYERGYNTQFGSFVKCGAVIINDVDDMVHSQHQGRLGMLNDISILSEQHKLVDMTKRFLKQGFDVYISADHGNTPCTGLGKLMGTGVETETKSRRMIVLQNFADKDSLQQKYGLIEYPKYYMNKDFDYLICEVGDSFDAKGDEVMTHGGISIDEVVVPFIKIKAVDING